MIGITAFVWGLPQLARKYPGMTERNKQLAEIFHLLGFMYQFTGEKLPFRAMAYQKASQVISALPEDISQYLERDELTDLPGIGESMAQDIEEFIQTGTVTRFEKLKSKVPYQLMHLMDINGFGPESLKKIHQELKLTTEEQVIQALEDGRIRQLRGFGQKKSTTC
jgi:DNA polymerase (family X)